MATTNKDLMTFILEVFLLLFYEYMEKIEFEYCMLDGDKKSRLLVLFGNGMIAFLSKNLSFVSSCQSIIN